MPEDLLREALARAETVTPAVKTAAWLHSARVLYRFDQQRAVDLLRRAVALIVMLPEDDRETMNFAAAALAATVSPPAAFALADRLPRDPMGGPLTMMLNHMAMHGFRADAVAYLADPPPDKEYPFHAITLVVGSVRDDEERRKVLRGALRAFGRAAEQTSGDAKAYQHPRGEFLQAFAFLWRALPPDECRVALRALVRWILAAPDQRMSSGSGGDISFSSSREMNLFTLIGPLRALDPDRLAALLADHPQLKRAAEKLPQGFYGAPVEAVRPEAPPDAPPPVYEPKDNFGGRFMSVKEAVASGFAASFAAAERLYAADSSPTRPNEHPCEVWPSTAEYRTVLHQAGRYEGRSAVRHLARVPDTDLRLLASLELAAALVGLPLLGHRTMPPGVPRHRPKHPTFDELPPELQARIKAHQREALPPPRKPNRAPSPDASVTRSTKAAGARPGGGCGPDFWTMEHVPLRPVLARLYDTLPGRVEMPAALEAGRYDFTLVLKEDATARTMIRLMQEAVVRDLGVTIGAELQARDVFVLGSPGGIQAPPRREDDHGRGMSLSSMTWRTTGDDTPRDDSIDLTTIMDLGMARGEDTADSRAMMRAVRDLSRRLHNPESGMLAGLQETMTMADLAEILEVALGRPVVDETGLEGRYDLLIEPTPDENDTFVAALARTHGLVLTAARRDVPMLVVRPR